MLNLLSSKRQIRADHLLCYGLVSYSWLPHNPHESLCCMKVASCISRPDASSWTNIFNMDSRCELLGSICLLCGFMQCLLMCLPVPFQCWLSSQIGHIKNQEWPKNTNTKTKETEWQTAPLRRLGRNMVERQAAIYLIKVLGGFCMFQDELRKYKSHGSRNLKPKHFGRKLNGAGAEKILISQLFAFMVSSD